MSRQHLVIALLTLCTALAVACGGRDVKVTPPPAADAGTFDAGTTDAGAADAGFNPAAFCAAQEQLNETASR